MLNAHVSGHGEGTHDADVRDIHELTPSPRPPPIATVQFTRREDWENSSHRLSNLSTATAVSMENFSSMNREINAMVISRPTVENGSDDGTTVARMGDDPEETNPLAIVPDNSSVDPIPSQGRVLGPSTNSSVEEGVSVHSVKKEEVESKIVAWQTAEIAKANNKFKREDAIINGWESAEVQKATTWMKKVERKLEEKKAKAQEKMQNEMAKARQKAEERRASAESKRGTKVARILELANVMRVVGRAPSKRSFF